jgi:hypothetical protein
VKIRWNRDSIRLRITPTEFAAITNGDTVHEGIAFPGMQFWNVTLRPSDAETMIASDQHGVYFSLSEADRASLADPEAEGVYFEITQPTILRYYVEKDFPCVHKPAPESGEGTSETFTPPSGFEARKLTPTEINGD